MSCELTGEQQIVVDGYNVIYADDALRQIALKDMERARRELLLRIETYLAGKSLRVTVVFDGRGEMTDTQAVVPDKLQVIFSDRHRTADDWIVSMLATAESPRSYLVVSSDRMHIRPAVSELGCRSIGARAFLDRISGRDRPPSRRDEEEKPQPGSNDMGFWMERFEDDPKDDG